MRIGVGDAAADQKAYDDQQQAAADATTKLAQGKQLSPMEQANIAIGVLGLMAFAVAGPGGALFISGAWAGGLLFLKGLVAIFGSASAGAGCCADHSCVFHPWTDPHVGPPSAPPTNAFEAFAQPLIGRAWELVNNCGPNMSLDVFVHGLADKWNAAHDGPGITYTEFKPSSWGAGDPLLYSVKTPMYVALGAPNNRINTPTLHRPPTGNFVSPVVADSGLSTGAKVAIAVPVVSAVGVGIYSWVTGQAFGAVLDKVWRGAKKLVSK
jgi:hypothetical protein